MIDIARKLDKADREALQKCAMYLKKMEQYAYASEIYTKMGDTRALVMLHVEAHHWDEVTHIGDAGARVEKKNFAYSNWNLLI